MLLNFHINQRLFLNEENNFIISKYHYNIQL